MFKNLLNARNERKFGEAIAARDLSGMQSLLDKGVRRVDFMLMQPADFGTGQTKIPAGKFNDPVKLAREVGLPSEGMRLLASYGLHEAPPLTHPPSRPR